MGILPPGNRFDLGKVVLAVLLALAALGVWLLPGRERRDSRRQTRTEHGLLPRRSPQSKNVRAQGVLAAVMAAKFGKVMFTGGSMLMSLAGYAVLFGWRYGVGIIVMLFVHELGHLMAARRRNLEVTAMGFVPFLGAYVTHQRTNDPDTEFQVAIAGPLIGSLAAVAALAWGTWSGDRLGLAIAYTGFVLNLFNLAPIPGLDGGHATAALGPRVWLAGLPLLLGFVAWQFQPMLLMVALLAIPHAVEAWRTKPTEPRYWFSNRMDPRNRSAYAATYFGLACMLAFAAITIHPGG